MTSGAKPLDPAQIEQLARVLAKAAVQEMILQVTSEEELAPQPQADINSRPTTFLDNFPIAGPPGAPRNHRVGRLCIEIDYDVGVVHIWDKVYSTAIFREISQTSGAPKVLKITKDDEGIFRAEVLKSGEIVP